MIATLIAALTLLFLLPTGTNASDKPPDLNYIFEVCRKAYPGDINEAAKCITKTAGLDGPPPTDEEIALRFGPPDDPGYVQEVQDKWEKEFNTVLSTLRSCNKEQPGSIKCLAEELSAELTVHNKLLESLQPGAWPKGLGPRYATTHAMRTVLERKSLCESVTVKEKDQCLKTLDEEHDSFFWKGWHIYINKAVQQMEKAERRQAARQREIISHEQQLRQEENRTQREHELELARIQALGLILGNGGLLRPVPPMPTYQPQPVPTPVIPSYQPNRVSPPISCTSQQAGSTTYTNCY